MRAHEGIAVAYFTGLALAAVAARAGRRRPLVLAAALAMMAVIIAVARYGGDGLRAWAPQGYLMAGYWLPALLAPDVAHPTKFERWLHRADSILWPEPRTAPRVLTHLLELAYLLCYPLVPASFVLVWTQGSSADVHRFWVAVLVAGYACYATLPWLVSRPPRLAVPAPPAARGLAALNVFVLGRVSHRLNTFPSGHVAVVLAAAAGVACVSAPAGAAAGILGAAIAAGAVAGRYHYVMDVVLGVLVAAAAAAIAFT